MPTSTAARPTKLCSIATSCGICVISTRAATEPPIAAPIRIAGINTTRPPTCTPKTVAAIAIAMPSTP